MNLQFGSSASTFQLEVFEDVKIEGFDPALYQVNQVWFASKDGTEVPMYIIHKKV